MAKYYPDTSRHVTAGHPFMLAACHGSAIHDVMTRHVIPEQEEIMVLFPVLYKHENGQEYMCSYVPVLYLDSVLGVVGGLWYGLRKLYRPGMQHQTTRTFQSWSIKNVFSASIEKGDDLLSSDGKLPPFFEQTYRNPFVTLSYALPVSRLVFYQAQVYPKTVQEAIQNFFWWNYHGTKIQGSDDTLSVFSEYRFTMSKPMNAKQLLGN